MDMKRSIGLLLALGLTLGGSLCAWTFFGNFPSATYLHLPNETAVPGQLWAYRVPFLFEDFDSVALEIRRSSTPNDPDYSVGSVNGGLVTSRDDAEMILSTGRVTSTRFPDGVSVATWVIEMDNLVTAPSAPDQWRVAGNVKISGVSSSISPQEDFCLGRLVSAAWEQAPKWNGSEICVGRFRSHDDERIYDYYCVVVADDSKNYLNHELQRRPQADLVEVASRFRDLAEPYR